MPKVGHLASWEIIAITTMIQILGSSHSCEGTGVGPAWAI
jgi:hypothetical protein